MLITLRTLGSPRERVADDRATCDGSISLTSRLAYSGLLSR